MDEIFFQMRRIVKQYPLGDEVSTVLRDIDLDVQKGEYLSVLGPSGSGKSTLMNIIGCLDLPTSGEYILRGQPVEELDEKELAHIRRREIGFIFQNSQMLKRMDAMKNVELPLIYAGVRPRERARRAEEMLPAGSSASLSQPAFRRPAAARRHCPRAGYAPQPPPGRRTDRRPGSDHRPADHGAVQRAEQ